MEIQDIPGDGILESLHSIELFITLQVSRLRISPTAGWGPEATKVYSRPPCHCLIYVRFAFVGICGSGTLGLCPV